MTIEESRHDDLLARLDRLEDWLDRLDRQGTDRHAQLARKIDLLDLDGPRS